MVSSVSSDLLIALIANVTVSKTWILAVTFICVSIYLSLVLQCFASCPNYILF